MHQPPPNDDFDPPYEAKPFPRGMLPHLMMWRELPHYLEDVNTTLDFVRVLAGKGWNCRCNNGLDTTWECEFTRPVQPSTHQDNIGELFGNKLEIHYGAGDTLAQAICQAGLSALGKWVES